METAAGSGMTRAKVSQNAVAQSAGVSISTVSRVLNGLPGVADDVRTRVLDAARSLGVPMQPSAIVALRRVMVVGHISRVQMTATGFYAPVLNAMVDECARHGITVTYVPVDGGEQADAFALNQLRASPFDGVIFLATDSEPLMRKLAQSGTPMIVVNTELKEIFADCILVDNEFAPRMVIARLVALGHRRILRFEYPGRATTRRREHAFASALEDAGVAGVYAPVIAIPNFDTPAAYDAMNRYLKTHKPTFTACVCPADPVAVGALRALLEHGLAVPDDVSITGYNDEPLAALLSPPLSTIHVDGENMGRVAVRRLMERAALPNLPPVQITLACPFVERASIAPPRTPPNKPKQT